jgi:hypothetical protein
LVLHLDPALDYSRKSFLVTSDGSGGTIVTVSDNLLRNGDFETSANGFSTTQTPTGWTNIGHSDGVIPYATFHTPAYNGRYFYDLGGYGSPPGPVGDGIAQTVTTIPGTTYQLTFGLSSEDVKGTSTLRVSLGTSHTDYNLTSTGTYIAKGFVTKTIKYVATSKETRISFIEVANSSGGNNDPLIDNVIFKPVDSKPSSSSSHVTVSSSSSGTQNSPSFAEEPHDLFTALRLNQHDTVAGFDTITGLNTSMTNLFGKVDPNEINSPHVPSFASNGSAMDVLSTTANRLANTVFPTDYSSGIIGFGSENHSGALPMFSQT